MARDLNFRLHRCRYCDRHAVRTWDADLLTCDHSLCKDSAFRVVALRSHSRPLVKEPPYESPVAAR